MKILFASLGCDKNLVDTEVMLGLLREKGFEFTDDENEADVVVVNTCCFVHDAKQESIDTICQMAVLKEEAKCKALIVTGCLAQRYKDEIIKEIPEVDAVLGTSSYDSIVSAVEEALKGKSYEVFEDINRLPVVVADRIVTTGGYSEYLKIAEGCDKHCTYCIIPKIRGDFRSFPMETIVEQAEKLALAGVKELVLVAQEITVYGTDIYGKKSLHILLEKLNAIEGIEWIRLLYCYPEEIDDDFIAAMKNLPKVCHYIDMPIQHSCDAILKKMGRRTSHDELVEIIGKLRKEIPDIVIRTSLIAGFPGETEEMHQEMLDFVDEIEFDRLGVFTYSPEEGTPAYSFEGQVDEEIKERWRDEIMELQQEVCLDKSQDRVGKTLKVMIEGKVADENAYVGRTYMDAPNVDGYIFVNTDENLMSGAIVPVKVTGAMEYDLIGEIDYEFAE